ncbi:MAG TPA: RICIN domain-containing protein, partial [Verrucomicrobiae bacterium]|nr:RICIN domain-containing protein [Verrucomicrobiae bacterium]
MTVTRCDVSGSPAHAGISIQNATQATCVDNNCHNNSVGIWMANCAYANIANNTCENNTMGIDFNSGNDNNIVNNTCNNNGTGILLDGSSSIIASDAMGGNTVAGINSSGSGNIFADNLFTSGNAADFINGGSGDKIVAYEKPLSASGQTYFYPPLIDNQHTNTTIVNGKGRTDLTIASTTIASVQSQYNAAVSANPNNVIVLHLNGTFTVGSAALTLSSYTCVLLNGTIQINSSTGASTAIAGTNLTDVSISGGTIDGGNLTGNDGIYFTGDSMFQIDAMTLQNFGADGTREGGSDVIRIDHGSTPRIFTRCKISGGAARGLWLATSGVKNIVSDCESTGVNEDGVDCDESTSGSVIKFCYLHDNVRYGIFIEQSASHNLALGNVCNNDQSYGIGCYNNSATPRGDTAFNSVICNAIMGNGGLRNGSTGTNIVVSSHNFFFNNTLVNTTIHSDLYGTQNYYSQNYLSGTSFATSASTAIFNSSDTISNLFVQDSNSGLAVLVQNASTSSGAAVVIGQASGLGNDQWQLIPTDSGYYQIKNKNSGLDINVSGASTNAGAPVIQYAFGSAKNDQWMPVSAGNGLYNFINRLSGLYLDVPSAGAGTQLDQQTPNGGANQQFNLTGTSPGPQPSFSMSASPASQTVIASNSVAFTVTVFTNTGFSGSVTFGVSGLPANTAASFNPSSLGGNGSSTLTVTTSNNTPIGVYALAISGTGTALTNNFTVNLVVSGSTAALPGTLVWTGASGAGTNWSTAQNWTNVTTGGFGPPGTNNIVIFTNLATVANSALTSPGSGVVNPANINNFVDSSFAISGLMDFANTASTSPVYHNIGIASGATLTLLTNLQVGGFTQFLFGDNNVTKMTVSGTGATLLVTNGGLTVSEDAATGPSNNAVLDLSGLDNFAMNGTQIRVGVEGSGSFHHASGIIYLAKVNMLTLTTAGYSDSANTGSPNSGNPALYIGHNGSAFGSGSKLYLGIVNNIFMDYATIGRGDTNALMAFNPAFLNQSPSVYIRGTNGDPTRVGVYVVGDGSSGAANNAPSTNDFTGGSVDAMINYLCVGRGRSGNSSSVGGSGVLTFNNGSINVNTLAVGFIYPSGSNSPAIGVVNVNGSGTLTI